MVLRLTLALSLLLAQPAAVSESTQLTALVNEFTARTRGAGAFAVLPTEDQAKADATWAGSFLDRLHGLHADRLSHDEWITYAMLENDAAIQKDAAQFFWFNVPITPYASPRRLFRRCPSRRPPSSRPISTR
jgi:hypothetical protein